MNDSAVKSSEAFKTKVAIPRFEQSLPMMLLRAREAAMRHFRPVFAEADLTEQQWRILRALSDLGEADISSLASACYISLPSMSGILKRLESRGLVKRKANGKDQRSSLILLTPVAKRLIKKLSPKLKACYALVEAQVGRVGLDQLYNLLEEVEAKLKTE